MTVSWPALTVGNALAVVVLLGVLVVAFVGTVHIENLNLWFFGLLSASILLK